MECLYSLLSHKLNTTSSDSELEDITITSDDGGGEEVTGIAAGDCVAHGSS